MDIINKGRSEKEKLDFDHESGWDSVMPFWNSHNRLYKGTIFIPVNTDHFTSTAGFGEYPDAFEAEAIDSKQQAIER